MKFKKGGEKERKKWEKERKKEKHRKSNAFVTAFY